MLCRNETVNVTGLKLSTSTIDAHPSFDVFSVSFGSPNTQCTAVVSSFFFFFCSHRNCILFEFSRWCIDPNGENGRSDTTVYLFGTRSHTVWCLYDNNVYFSRLYIAPWSFVGCHLFTKIVFTFTPLSAAITGCHDYRCVRREMWALEHYAEKPGTRAHDGKCNEFKMISMGRMEIFERAVLVDFHWH